MRVVITTTHSCNNIMQSVTLILFIRSWKMYIKKNLFTVPISVYNFLDFKHSETTKIQAGKGNEV